MKIYVWEDYCSDYTEGLAVVVAKDEGEARKLLIKSEGYEPDSLKYPPKIFSVNRKNVWKVHGGG